MSTSRSNAGRLLQELKANTANNKTESQFQLSTTQDNLLKWTAVMYGPENTPYSGFTFDMSIEVSSNYPFIPPKIRFETKILHPNINSEGAICMDTLKDKWSPALNLSSTMISIVSLLSDPNPDDPYNSDIARIFKNDRKLYDLTVRQHCEQNAKKRIITDADIVADSNGNN
jgi:ubiquitin-conjugating enzyme E2 D/E